MKYVETLSKAQQQRLRGILQDDTHHRARQRAHCILLSHERITMNELAKIFFVDRDTISGWINDWNTHAEAGLYDLPRSGRPPSLNEQDLEALERIAEHYPQQSQVMTEVLAQETGKKVSSDTVTRALKKKLNYVFTRARLSLKAKRDPALFEQTRTLIDTMLEWESDGVCNVYFFDEAGVSLRPNVPYVWHRAGQNREIPADSRSGRLNLLGFVSHTGDLQAYSTTTSVKSADVIAVFDAWIEANAFEQATFVWVDNASMHRSRAFCDAAKGWALKNVFVMYLCAYSPELNSIERVWRHMKAFWIKPSAYIDLDSLKIAVQEVLDNYGIKYRITFA